MCFCPGIFRPNSFQQVTLDYAKLFCNYVKLCKPGALLKRDIQGVFVNICDLQELKDPVVVPRKQAHLRKSPPLPENRQKSGLV